jgi:hypothetical protein
LEQSEGGKEEDMEGEIVEEEENKREEKAMVTLNLGTKRS